MSFLRFERVSKVYSPNVQALDDLSLHVNEGEFVSVIGQSGSGKSTLLKLVSAEETPTRGQIWIGNWDISRIRVRDIPLLRRQLGMVFQDYKLLPKKTIAENIAFALEVSGASRHEIREMVPRVLQVVRLQDQADRFPAQLSGGEQQRAAIARALIHQPKILLADEPTGNLDTHHTQEILDLLLRIHKLGTTILLVTHNRDVVNALQQRVIVLKDGKLVQDQPQGRYHLTI
ncbi:cell division ATP-binding protein FtsE [Patescibacteria group bacterium]|nr:cell division ATP-binding protein FtsE [Patescibacteria group bacterium]